MIDGYHHMWGTHWAWWIFWLLFLVVVIWMISGIRSSRRQGVSPNETPLEILKRRYASGEITSEEFDQMKGRLQEDD